VPTTFTVRRGEYLSFIRSHTMKVGVSPDSRDAEVSQRVSAERARWGRGGTRNRSSARVDAPLNDSARARR